MKVDSQLVSHVARLAHLKLSEEESSFYQEQLERILGYIEQLDELTSTSPSPESGHVILGKAKDLDTERTDEVLPGTSAEEAVSQAPEKSGTYFSVPRIIE